MPREEATEALSDRAPPARPLPVGLALGQTFSIWARNVVPFSVLSAVAFAPLILYTLRVDGPLRPGKDATSQGANFWWPVAAMFGGPILGLFAAGPLSYGVVQEMRGRRAPVLRCLGVGLRRLLPVLSVVALLVGAVVLWMIPGSVVSYAIFFDSSHPGRTSMAYSWALSVLSGVPVLLCLVRLSLAVPVATVERGGGFRAFARSRALTKGNRWRVFGVFTPLFLLHWGGLEGIAWLTGALAPEGGGWLVYVWISLVFSVVVSNCLMAVASAVVYYDRRVAKEGVTVEDIAKVFD